MTSLSGAMIAKRDLFCHKGVLTLRLLPYLASLLGLGFPLPKMIKQATNKAICTTGEFNQPTLRPPHARARAHASLPPARRIIVEVRGSDRRARLQPGDGLALVHRVTRGPDGTLSIVGVVGLTQRAIRLQRLESSRATPKTPRRSHVCEETRRQPVPRGRSCGKPL